MFPQSKYFIDCGQAENTMLKVLTSVMNQFELSKLRQSSAFYYIELLTELLF